MFDLDALHNIWQTITKNKGRSVITAFGVFWGILMLVMLFGFGLGLQRSIMGEVDQFAINSTFIMSRPTSEPYKGFAKDRYWNISLDDLEAVRQRVPGLRYSSGIIFGNSSTNNVVHDDKYGTFQTMGLSPEYIEIEPCRILEGRFINDLDVMENRKVCVVGKRIKNDLYTHGEPIIGSLLRVNGVYYTVVGVIDVMSQNISIFISDENIYLPFTTLQQTQNMGKIIHSIALTAKDNVDIFQTEDFVKAVLKERNMISPTDPKAVETINLFNIFSVFKNLELGVIVVIWFVGLGMLLAGAIGVSNIMLITVRERTQEIGILRALGASPRSIIMQIMSESFMLTAMAGTLGIMIGVGLLSLINKVLLLMSEDGNPMDVQITFSLAVISLIVITIAGILAGMLPAYKAIKIKPVEALQDE